MCLPAARRGGGALLPAAGQIVFYTKRKNFANLRKRKKAQALILNPMKGCQGKNSLSCDPLAMNPRPGSEGRPLRSHCNRGRGLLRPVYDTPDPGLLTFLTESLSPWYRKAASSSLSCMLNHQEILTGLCSTSPALQDGVKGHNMKEIPCGKAPPFRAGSFTCNPF